MIIFRATVTAISIFLMSGLQLLHAETRTDYAVDLVVFEDSESRYLGSEQWQPPSIEIELAGELQKESTATPGSLPKAVKRPEISDIRTADYELLDSEVKKLQASKRYRILVRKSWLQPGLDADKAVDIELASQSGAGENVDNSAGTLTGSVKIVLERYLHLYTDLVYHKPIRKVLEQTAANASVSNTTGAELAGSAENLETHDFIIREHRRMRSRELHYIDHPLVGMLVKIVPVETEIEVQTAPAADASTIR